MQEFIIDKKRWRCGGDGEFRLGEGQTMLKNQANYYCCLGMIIEQINNEINILDRGNPFETDLEDDLLVDIDTYSNNNSLFSLEAMEINDNLETTVEEKIKLLTELGEQYNIKLSFID